MPLQLSRPFVDVSSSGWTPTPIWPQIGEPTPDDSTLVTSSADPGGDTFEVKLRRLAWPQTGNQTLRVRVKKTDTGNVPVSIALVQGTTIIANRNMRPTQNFSPTYAITLTDVEKRLITDYTNLRVRVTAGYPILVPCCANRLPDTLRLTMSNATGNWLDPIFIIPPHLTAQDGGSPWESPTSVPIFQLFCFGTDCSGFQLAVAGNLFFSPAAGCTCNPFSLRFEGVYQNLPPDGTATFTLSE